MSVWFKNCLLLLITVMCLEIQNVLHYIKHACYKPSCPKQKCTLYSKQHEKGSICFNCCSYRHHASVRRDRKATYITCSLMSITNSTVPHLPPLNFAVHNFLLIKNFRPITQNLAQKKSPFWNNKGGKLKFVSTHILSLKLTLLLGILLEICSDFWINFNIVPHLVFQVTMPLPYVMTIFYSPTLVAQQKERQIDEKLGTT